ncbi:MAG: Holliday junction branch migration protein RuvA [Actinobacteria bacterium]|nr:Holliday junction branch migration protein RuvA [Actinomycetota bacterium]
MIASVTGTVLFRELDHVVVEAAGVGYQLNVSARTMDAVPATGGVVTLHAELVVREDAMQLYGFAGADEKRLFNQLTSVSGVGPKVALALLSGMTVAEAEGALLSGDLARFQKVPGIGKRTAERLIVELKDKVLPGGTPVVTRAAAPDDPRSIAREGLIGLGYSPAEADGLLSGASGDSAEALIAAALRGAAA